MTTMLFVRYRGCPEARDALDPFRFRTSVVGRGILFAACLARVAWEMQWCEGLGGT